MGSEWCGQALLLGRASGSRSPVGDWMTEGDGALPGSGITWGPRRQGITDGSSTHQAGTPFAQPRRISYEITENTAAREARILHSTEASVEEAEKKTGDGLTEEWRLSAESANACRAAAKQRYGVTRSAATPR